MKTKAIRLREYLAKIEQQHYWDDGQMRDPHRGLFAERPDVTKDEERAFAMGHLSEFREAAREKRDALTDADIASVARVSLSAAASFRRDAHQHDAQSIMRSYEEAQAQKERVIRRWNAQESERSVEREDHVWNRLGGKAMPPEAPKMQPESARGGFAEHANRESALEEARRHTQEKKSAQDLSPDIG